MKSSDETASDDADKATSAIDLALDLVVFAPLGFLLDSQKFIPELAQAGRRQVAFSQSLGRAAIHGLTKGLGATRTAATPTPASVRGEVDGYDAMTARDVVALLADADDATCAWIEKYESTNKARVTVLRAARAARD